MKKTAGYIGLDVGSSGCKAAVLDQKGNILTEKRREYSFEYPAKGRVELNPVTVWNCVKKFWQILHRKIVTVSFV